MPTPRSRRLRRPTPPRVDFTGNPEDEAEEALMDQEIEDAKDIGRMVTAMQQLRRDIMTLAKKIDQFPDVYVTRREIDAMVAAAKPMSDQWRETVSELRDGQKELGAKVDRQSRELGERLERFNEGAYDRFLRNQDRAIREGRNAEDAARSVRDDFMGYQLGQARDANDRSFTISQNSVGWIVGVAGILVAILIGLKVI